MSGSTPVQIWSTLGRLEPLYGRFDRIPVNLNPISATVPLLIPPGMVLGEVLAAQGLYSPYNPGASDGTQNAKGILEYQASVVGTNGAYGQPITWVGGEWPGVTYYNVPMIYGGHDGMAIDIATLVGLDSSAVTSLGGSVVSGALAAAEVDSIAQTGGTGTWGLTVPAFTWNGLTFPATVIANTALSATISAATLVTDINAALAANGIPAYVTATGGALGSSPIVVTWHQALLGVNLVITVDNTNMSGGTVAVTRSTHGAPGYGILRIG